MKNLSEYINLDYNLIETSPLKKEINQKGDMIVDLDNLKKII